MDLDRILRDAVVAAVGVGCLYIGVRAGRVSDVGRFPRMADDPVTARLLLLSILIGCTYAAYGPHIRTSKFVYEDALWEHAGPAGPIRRHLTRASWDWFRLPTTAHEANLAIHVLNVCLLFLLARRLGLSEMGAWMIAGFWLLHSMNVEAVGYAAQRGELIAGTGVLAACLAATFQRWWALPLIGLCLLVGLMGKETASFGLLLTPLTYWYLYRQPRVWLLAGFIILAAVYYMGGPSIVANMGEESTVQVDAPVWLLVQSIATVRLILLSIGLGVQSPDYDFYQFTLSTGLACLTCLLVLAGVTVLLLKDQPLIGFGLAWMLLGILPRLFLQTPKSPYNEHQFYLPLIGPIFSLVAFTERWKRHDEVFA